LQTWDYGSNGAYFITICTKNREHFFGEIVVSTNDGMAKMELNSIGRLAEKWQPNTIGSIINQYKRMVTINARIIIPAFGWQSRFHDHIIRDAKSFNNIQNYIANNPQNWKGEKFYRE
jgi:putative transposase